MNNNDADNLDTFQWTSSDPILEEEDIMDYIEVLDSEGSQDAESVDDAVAIETEHVELADLSMPQAPSWDRFLEGFKSADIYKKRVEHFYQYGYQKSLPRSLDGYFENAETALHDYFIFHHKKYAPTTQRSWLAIFNKYWLHTGRGNLTAKMPIIESDIDKWIKGFKTTKAKTFEADEIGNKIIFVIY